jgi:hypothetical protein
MSSDEYKSLALLSREKPFLSKNAVLPAAADGILCPVDKLIGFSKTSSETLQ